MTAEAEATEYGDGPRARRTGPVRIDGENQVPLPTAALRTPGLRPGDLADINDIADIADIAEEGRQIVIRRRRSRLDGVTGTVPGLSEAVDVEASRASRR
ncbi:hypothetical protein [Streptosporangium sp. NPDC002524]|uniref:hypothetical protein n=1 Tax=Streptosporangium sp. NPDC002524 TaxID=3154537 RepID=UPI00331B1416